VEVEVVFVFYFVKAHKKKSKDTRLITKQRRLINFFLKRQEDYDSTKYTSHKTLSNAMLVKACKDHGLSSNSLDDLYAELIDAGWKVPKKKSFRSETSGSGFYTSPSWRAVRYQALSRSSGACCLCGRTAKDGVKLHVDHIKPRSRFPELELDVDNLQVLCEDCNLGKSNVDTKDWR